MKLSITTVIAAAAAVSAEGASRHHLVDEERVRAERHLHDHNHVRTYHERAQGRSSGQANDATFPETECFDNKITAFLQAKGIPGASAAVMKDGEIVYAQGYGTRDVPGIGEDLGRPVSQCTPFRLASLSKPVTSLAILQLVEAGLMSLEDKVFGEDGILSFFTENEDVKDERIYDITVEHLLHHSGGWDSKTTFDPMFRSVQIAEALDVEAPAECWDVMFFMLDEPLQFDPGTQMKYSNFGYCILGRVIEEIVDLPYEDAVRQVLLDPAGVDEDEFYMGSSLLENIPEVETEYYQPNAMTTSVFPEIDHEVPWQYGGWYLEAMDSHGGWVSSAVALMKMMSSTTPAHCDNNVCLFSDDSLEKLTAIPPFFNENYWYGLGFSMKKAGSDENWWHNGSLDGTKTLLIRTNDSYGYSFALLFNSRAFEGSMDALIWDAVGCVGDNWPDEFETTCSW